MSPLTSILRRVKIPRLSPKKTHFIKNRYRPAKRSMGPIVISHSVGVSLLLPSALLHDRLLLQRWLYYSFIHFSIHVHASASNRYQLLLSTYIPATTHFAALLPTFLVESPNGRNIVEMETSAGSMVMPQYQNFGVHHLPVPPRMHVHIRCTHIACNA